MSELEELKRTTADLSRKTRKLELLLSTWPYSEKKRLIKEAELVNLRLKLRASELVLEDALIRSELSDSIERLAALSQAAEAESNVMKELQARRDRVTDEVDKLTKILDGQLQTEEL